MAETITISVTEQDETITVTLDEAARGPAGTVIDSYASDIATLPDYPTSFPTTPADISNVGHEKLLGRHGAGTGTAQEIGIDGGLELHGGNLRTSAITGPVTIGAGGSTSAIADAALSIAMTSGLQTALDAKAALAGATFTGQIELSGQAATNATSAMTRGLADARYARSWAAALSAGVNSDANTTTYKTVTELSFALEVGTYFIECILIHNGNASYATAGVKDRLNFTGTATATGTLYRGLDNSTTASSTPSGVASRNPTIESAQTNRSQTTWRQGILTVTAAGTLQVQIAQTVAVAAAFTTLDTGSSISITKV